MIEQRNHIVTLTTKNVPQKLLNTISLTLFVPKEILKQGEKI